MGGHTADFTAGTGASSRVTQFPVPGNHTQKPLAHVCPVGPLLPLRELSFLPNCGTYGKAGGSMGWPRLKVARLGGNPFPFPLWSP